MSLPEKLPLPVHLPREEFAISRYFCEAPPGVMAQHVVDPDFWAHLAKKLRRHDEITVVAADGSFDLALRVIDLDPRGFWARVRVLRATGPAGISGLAAPERPKPQWPDRDGYTVEHNAVHGWRIVNRAGDIVARDLPDEAAALAELATVKAAKKKAA